MNNITRRITAGKGSQTDIDLLFNVATQMQGKCLCALGEFSTMAVTSGIEKFRKDFEALVKT
jgi:NADH-quinone oxidoreductase subunit F